MTIFSNLSKFIISYITCNINPKSTAQLIDLSPRVSYWRFALLLTVLRNRCISALLRQFLILSEYLKRTINIKRSWLPRFNQLSTQVDPVFSLPQNGYSFGGLSPNDHLTISIEFSGPGTCCPDSCWPNLANNPAGSLSITLQLNHLKCNKFLRRSFLPVGLQTLPGTRNPPKRYFIRRVLLPRKKNTEKVGPRQEIA